MRRVTLSAILFFLGTSIFCQVMRNDSLFSNGERFFQPKKFDYNLTMGSEFTSVSGYGSGLNTYVTPHVSYNLNRRLRIGGGISIMQTNYFKTRSYFQHEQGATASGNFSTAMIFIDGQYIVNNRLTISGSAYKQLPVSRDPLPYNPFNPVSARGSQGINLNVGYKVGEHIYIEAGFRYSDGLNPGYNDPFNRNSYLNDSYAMPSGFGMPRW